MKVSRARFITVFVLSAFVFQFTTNSLLGDETGLFPPAGEWYPGMGSPVPWKNNTATVLHPLKYVLIEPLSFLNEEPDTPPPVLLMGFGLYWTAIAFVLHFLISRSMRNRVSPG